MDLFEALADPTRREIVALLAAGERNAGDIAGRFKMKGPSVSRHLKVLRESGLITFRAAAQSRIYRLDAARLEEVKLWVQVQLDLTRGHFGTRDKQLDQMKEGGD